jgi:hypothetical protein
LPGNRPFTIDEDYGTHYASYLAGSAQWFSDLTNTGVPTADVTRFAEYAFRIALIPIMVPGYVRTHARIQDVATDRDQDDRLAIEVSFAAPLPGPVAAAIAGRGWHEWDRDYHNGLWFTPEHNDRPAAYTLITIRVPIVPDALPTPDYDRTGAPRVRAGKAAVEQVCRQLNRALDDVFTALDNPTR